MTKKLYITFALLGSLLITSCDSFLDIQPIGKVIPNTLSEIMNMIKTIIRKLRNGTTLILFPVHVNLLGAIIIALSIMPTP